MTRTKNQLAIGETLQTLRLVGVLYPGTMRIFVLTDGGGSYFIRQEGGDILNATSPFHQYPSTRTVKEFLKNLA